MMSSHRKIKSDQLPKSKVKRKQSTSRSSFKTPIIDFKLPQIADVPKPAKEKLFVRKLKICSLAFDFLEGTEMKEKQFKFNTLKELILFITEEGNISSLTESTYREIVNMVAENIFRAFPPSDFTEYEPEYDEQAQEAAWPHLKLVYDMLLHLINSPEVNLSFLKKAISRSFIIQLLETFNTEDTRERKCLKNVLLSIYLKLFEQRPFIRKQITNLFLRYIYETDQFNGIAELLEILNMAINGFNVPLRQEHKDFLLKVLIPLHISRYLAFYHKSLIDCLKGYMKKDENLIEPIILGILRYWPKTCTEKEVLFMQEICELLEIVKQIQFLKIQAPLMNKLSRSVTSLHHQVAEVALTMWDHPDFSRHFHNNVKTIMPIMFLPVLRTSKNHWNSSVTETAKHVLHVFNEADSALFNSLIAAQRAKAKKGVKRK